MRHRPRGPRPDHVPSAAAPAARYDAPGDPALGVAAALRVDAPFSFDAGLARRLAMREINAKESFTVQDGAGAWFRASVTELSERGGTALAFERLARSPEPSIDLTLACAVLARQRMIFVAQKATELGVSRIVPLLTEHSVQPGGLEHEKAHAWRGQLVRAARQCRRASLPALSAPTALGAFIEGDTVKRADLCVALDDRANGARPRATAPRKVVLVVGPEGGFSDRERALLAKVAAPWTLGGRVVRAETAVLVGLTAVQLAWGDFAEGA